MTHARYKCIRVVQKDNHKRLEMDEQMMLQTQENRENEEEATPIYGDLLETILSFVPLVDLVSAYRVSTSWRRAVFSSLTKLNKVKPWIFIHTQSNWSLEAKSMDAYDPRSNAWVKIGQPIIKHVSTIKSSGPNLLYVLSGSKLSFSDDPFHLTWAVVDGPRVWRMDPIVARCGAQIVVAGSGWYFEDDPLAVEVYDPDLSTWRRCQSMPEMLKGSASATWLSVAANHNEMFVTVKSSGTTFAFDPCAGKWRGPYDLKADPHAFFSAIGFASKDLMVACLIGDASQPESLRLSKVNCETMACERICEAPREILEKLMGEKATTLRQVEVCPADNFVYLYNPSDPEELVFCDLSGGGDDCVWGSTRNTAWNDDVKIGGKMVFTCGRVEIGDLLAVMRSAHWKLVMNY